MSRAVTTADNNRLQRTALRAAADAERWAALNQITFQFAKRQLIRSLEENEPVSYAIEFTDWAEWLGMEVDPTTLASYEELEILSHCLWEMTFMGYTPEAIQQAREQLDQARKSVDRLSYEEIWLDVDA